MWRGYPGQDRRGAIERQSHLGLNAPILPGLDMSIPHHPRSLAHPPKEYDILTNRPISKPLLRLCFGFAPHSLHQRMNNRVGHFAAPLGRQLPRRRIRTGQGRRKRQLLLQCRTHLLVSRQTPSLPHRTAPMPVLRVLAVPDLQLNDSEDAAQMHRLALAAVRLSSAEGGEPRRGGYPLPGAFAPRVAASIRGLLPILPSRSRAGCALAYGPSS